MPKTFQTFSMSMNYTLADGSKSFKKKVYRSFRVNVLNSVQD